MLPTSPTRFGVDLITFYHPEFWGVGDYEEIVVLAEKDPLALWTRILDGVQAAGIELIEMTFPPADCKSAIAAYGSAAAFRRELESRGLGLKSGFYIALDWNEATDRHAAADDAAAYAEFIRDAGGDTMVVGPPMRTSRDAVPPKFIDHAYMSNVADILHHVGDATLRQGVRTAVHTEAHSIFCTQRDVDLLMTLTDPEYVFMCPDTGHLTLSGADPTRVMEHHRDRMIIAHWKDAIGPMPAGIPIDEAIHLSHREYFRRVGAGAIDWFRWTELARHADLSGVTLLELDAVPDPVADMIAAREYISTALGLVAGPSFATSPLLTTADRS
jgi:sugar phosphate isomerase/epimerase